MDGEGQYLTKYLDFLTHIKRFSDHTVKAYRQDIEQFFKFFQENQVQVEKNTIRDFISTIYLKSKQKSTVSRKIYAIKSYYAYLLQQGWISKNPLEVIDSPKVNKKLPEILTEKEMSGFLDQLPEANFIQIRNKALFELLYASGLRISELVHLQIENIDFPGCLLRVMGKGKKERIVPFNESAREILLRYLTQARAKFPLEQSFVFLNARGRPIGERGVEMILNAVYQDLIQTHKHVYPHLFRHSFATHLLQRGANLRIIQELLGHSSLSTTEKYTNLTYEDLLKTYQTFHPRDNPDKEDPESVK